MPKAESPLTVIPESSMSSSLPQSQTISSPSTSPPPPPTSHEADFVNVVHIKSPGRTDPRIIKQRSFSTKTIYRHNSGMTNSRSSEQTNVDSLPSRSTQGRCSPRPALVLNEHCEGASNSYVLKPKSLEDDESDLQRKSATELFTTLMFFLSQGKVLNRRLLGGRSSMHILSRLPGGCHSHADLAVPPPRLQANRCAPNGCAA